MNIKLKMTIKLFTFYFYYSFCTLSRRMGRHHHGHRHHHRSRRRHNSHRRHQGHHHGHTETTPAALCLVLPKSYLQPFHSLVNGTCSIQQRRSKWTGYKSVLGTASSTWPSLDGGGGPTLDGGGGPTLDGGGAWRTWRYVLGTASSTWPGMKRLADVAICAGYSVIYMAAGDRSSCLPLRKGGT